MADALPIDPSLIDRWTNQWMKQLGFTNEQLLKRHSKVEKFARFVFVRIEAKKSKEIEKREQLLLEALREYEHRLCRTGFENDITEDFESMQLKQKELFIEKKHQELDNREEKYIKDLDQLSQRERILCQTLTEPAMDITTDEPLIKRIERLESYLQTLEQMKTERLTTIKSYRARLKDLCSRLDFNLDNSSIACQLIDEQYERCLTADSLGQIECLLNELERKSDEQEKQVNRLVATLEKLYTKLSGDGASPPKRSAAYILRHNTAETVKQLENEIAQLQAKRMATSQAYCESMRVKIAELYEQCHLGVAERNPIDFDNITPETLDACDREYDRLDEMYHSRKPVLEAFEQWKLLVQQHAEFQKKSTSAARFHERGYSAVKEQAERKRFAIAVPKAERTCLNALEQWEKEHVDEQLSINDVPMRQIMEQQHASASNTTTATTTGNAPVTISKTASTTVTAAVPQRRLSKVNMRKKSLRNIIKPIVEQQVSNTTRHDVTNEDTLEFTQLENIRHINGVARIVTSTPKTGKTNSGHTVVDTGRNKTHDAIHKRRPSKRLIPTRR